VLDCGYVEGRLRAHIDEALLPAEQMLVTLHLEACARCRAERARMAAVVRELRSLPEVEPPPHFTVEMRVRRTSLGRTSRFSNRGDKEIRRSGLGERRPRWRWRYAAVGSLATAIVALVLLSEPLIVAAELVGRVQESWARLQSYSCTFVTEGLYRGQPRRFVQRQWFRKPNLFRLETSEHFPQTTYLEPRRVTVVIPGARWEGKPIAILRPRHPKETDLPFPFGSAWPDTADITIDALVRQLQKQQGGEILGTEPVLGKECYRLRFEARAPMASRVTHYLMWIDRDTFLPLRVRAEIDAENHSVTEAMDLHVNDMLPAGSFHYDPPAGTFVVRGDVEPFVFALGLEAARSRWLARDPLQSASAEITHLQPRLPFRPLAPRYVPDGFRLLRVRSSRGRWLDAYWIDAVDGRVIKLVQQVAVAPDPPEVAGGRSVPAVRSGLGHEVILASGKTPYVYDHLAWRQNGVLVLLATADLPREEALRVARSLAPADELPAEAHMLEARSS
jgi:outer membrane lipoprotein-sorting protein